MTRERASSEPPAALAGLDIVHVGLDDSGAAAHVGSGNIARLTLDPELQRTAKSLMAAHRIPEAAVVVMDVGTGNVLAYASHVEKGEPRDLCAEATAPAASVFKIVTGATLVEDASLTPETRQCYSGGSDRILPQDLVDDPQRDKWCATLAGAMGRSLNTVFARLAQRHLKPAQLESMAHKFGFGEPVPFDIPVQPSLARIPQTDALEFARTAAGFWNTTLSPLQAAEISAIVARGGEAIRPTLVREVVSTKGDVVYSASAPATRRVVGRDTAQMLATMMEHTVTEGTSYRAFRDTKGTAFLPNVRVAGKTGTLSDPIANRFYTWFTGFAPSRPIRSMPGVRPVAIGVLVVNQPTWQVKANTLARDVLRAYFAEQKVPSVTKPSASPVARRRR
jgi:cell division protein FtsI/penicillin-binding protein 2